MTTHDLLHIFTKGKQDEELHMRIILVLEEAIKKVDLKQLKFSKLFIAGHAAMSMRDAAHMAKFSHDTFLPAAKQWEQYLKHPHQCHYPEEKLRKMRARLAGSSRWLYEHQKKTFFEVVDLFIPFPINFIIPLSLKELLWSKLKAMERKQLSKARTGM